jgi:hypothetical protein
LSLTLGTRAVHAGNGIVDRRKSRQGRGGKAFAEQSSKQLQN